MVPPAAAAEEESDTFADHVISNSVTPSGIVLNLFDYWVTPKQTDSDHSTPLAENGAEKYWNTGINKGHALKFCSQGTGNNTMGKSINQWTGKDGGVYPNIVKDQLPGGFPVLKSGNLYSASNYSYGSGLPWEAKTSEESLSYLFDKSRQTGKEAFWNVQGLLQIDEDGYYYYNADSNKTWKAGSDDHSGYASANYAAFDKETNSFKLYDSWGVKASGSSSGETPRGQFFPFTDASKVFTEENGKLQSDVGSDSVDINHYFGLSMTTRFVQRYNGLTSKEKSEAKHVTYEFAGDDDVWLYIDGILVSDLGGIHNLATTSIDFYTGDITVGSTKVGTLRSVMEKYYEDDSYWNGNTFADNTYHTMKLFYLERGGSDSNLSMKFNLAHVPETDGYKVDQFGNALKDVAFTLYAAKAVESNGEIGYVIDDSDPKTKGVLASGYTDANGKFVLADGSDASISLNELRQKGIEHMILREDGDRTGYRPAEDIYLQLAPYDEDLLLLNDENHQWHTGTYTMPKETVYTNPNIVLQDADRNKIGEVDISEQGSGLLFAIIMRRLDGVGESIPSDNDDWGIVTGDALSGWKVTGRTSEDHISAALDMIHSNPQNNPKNYFVFEPCTNGSYMTELSNCPGDMRNYYFWLEDMDPENLQNAGYAIAYYYTYANSLDEATAENTTWVDSSSFERQFAATIYIPNVQNYLHVQKVDTKNDPVSGAQFSLYNAQDLTIHDSSDPDWGEIDALDLDIGGADTEGELTWTVNGDAKPVYTVTTDDNGMATFPSAGQLLDVGEYYLVESRAPNGYRINPTPVHVIVNEDGVLADAGTASDGVSVSLYEGTLVKTMTQYAVSDEIDRTLTDIIATKLVGTYDQKSGKLKLSETKVKSELTVDEEYFERTGMLRYRPQREGEHAESWVTDTGWIWFRMQQDYEGISTWGNSSAYKKYLGDKDITPLFAGETTVIMQDQAVSSLTIGKTVDTAEDSDTPAPDDQEFRFRLALKNEDGLIKKGTIIEMDGGSTVDGVEKPEDRILAFLTDDCTTEFTLRHGQTYTIDDLPVGTTWHVEELNDGLDTSKWTASVNGAAGHSTNGEIKKNERAAALFTNTYGEHIVYAPAVESGAFKVSKTYAEDSDEYTGEVSFAVEGVPTPTKTVVTIRGEGSADFGDVTFEAAGRYTYTVREISDSELGMKYDPTEYTVTFDVVEDKENRTLRVNSVSYASSEQVEFSYTPDKGMTFENDYRKPEIIPTKYTLSDALAVSKKYSGADKYDKTPMTFTLTPTGNIPTPDCTEVTIRGEGRADFGAITFDSPGEYVYRIRETDAKVDGMRCDSTVYTVTVTVMQNDSTSPLYAVVSYQTDDNASYDYNGTSSMVFVNRYDKPEETTGTLCIDKTVGGEGADQNGTFRFRVRVAAIDGTYDSVKFEQGEAIVAVRAGSSVSISGLPTGASYSVTEIAVDGYTVTSKNTSGRIQAGKTVTAWFYNEKTAGESGGDPGGRDDDGDTPALNRKEHYAYIIGYEDGAVRPNGNITRAEVATIFFRLLRDPVRAEYWSQTNLYPDVPQTAWFNNAVSTLTNMGIISGYEDGTFHPNAPITRAELTKIASGFFSDERVTSHYDGRFSDVSGSEWFIAALEKAIEEGVIEGYEDGTFGPNKFITRAESCTIINRTLGRKPHAERLLPASVMVTWPDSDPSAWYYAQMQEATNSHDYFWTAQSSKSVEKWTAKLTDRDWAALERVWSNAGSAAGGEAMN